MTASSELHSQNGTPTDGVLTATPSGRDRSAPHFREEELKVRESPTLAHGHTAEGRGLRPIQAAGSWAVLWCPDLPPPLVAAAPEPRAPAQNPTFMLRPQATIVVMVKRVSSRPGTSKFVPRL